MSLAKTTWISGPVLRARPQGPFRLREAVTVGAQAAVAAAPRPSNTCLRVVPRGERLSAGEVESVWFMAEVPVVGLEVTNKG